METLPARFVGRFELLGTDPSEMAVTSRSIVEGIDLNTVRELLGHKSVAMTLRYAHLAPEHKAAAVETLVAKARDGKAA